MTQQETAIAILMLDTNKYWHVEDMLNNGTYFASYKIQARISELALQYPEMIDRQMSSKGNRQHMYRIRWDNWRDFMPKLTQELRDCIADNKPVNLQFV